MTTSRKITILPYRKAFTLLEILIVISIGIALISLAIPRYRVVLERFTAKEGEQILFTLLASQKRYELDNGSYTSTLNDLDFDFNQPRNFGTINDDNVSDTPPIIAEVTRIKSGINLYKLHITDSGDITCDTEHTSVTGICKKMGY